MFTSIDLPKIEEHRPLITVPNRLAPLNLRFKNIRPTLMPTKSEFCLTKNPPISLNHRKGRIKKVSSILFSPQPRQIYHSSMNLEENCSHYPILSPIHFNNSHEVLTLPNSSPRSHAKFPMTPIKALQAYKNDLILYEQSEIMKYNEIYFISNFNKKIIKESEGHNFGFDDPHRNYLLREGDHIAYRYEILMIIGKGSFGQVCQCFDHKKKENIALKIIKNKKKYHEQARIEIKILQMIGESDLEENKNMVRMHNYFLFRSHVCISFELLSISLYTLLKKNNFNGLTTKLIKSITKQLLVALEHIRSLEIIHCDLKPENILLVNPQKALVKLIDFGTSCFMNERLHSYIQSRFYRAPEIILGIPYSFAIDMWSLGCILVELYTGKPLWPGESEFDQLLFIVMFLGMPPSELIDISKKKDIFFNGNDLISYKLSNGETIRPGSKKLKYLLKGAEKEFLEVVQKCLEWDPFKRIDPFSLLNLPWFAKSER